MRTRKASAAPVRLCGMPSKRQNEFYGVVVIHFIMTPFYGPISVLVDGPVKVSTEVSTDTLKVSTSSHGKLKRVITVYGLKTIDIKGFSEIK